MLLISKIVLIYLNTFQQTFGFREFLAGIYFDIHFVKPNISYDEAIVNFGVQMGHQTKLNVTLLN